MKKCRIYSLCNFLLRSAQAADRNSDIKASRLLQNCLNKNITGRQTTKKRTAKPKRDEMLGKENGRLQFFKEYILRRNTVGIIKDILFW